MDISIIIVNYNTTDFLSKCIDSIQYHTIDVEYEIIVIDNNSTIREIEKYPLKYSSVKFYFRNCNDGFGAGCNYGAQKASGKYLLFLNPDVVLISNILSNIFLLMEDNNDIAVTSPIYLEDSGKIGYTYNNFPNFKWEIYEAFGYGTSRKIRKLLSRDEIVNKIPFEVDWVMGSFIFTRSNVFNNIQGFDENIFLYYEDVDLQYRIKENGFKILCLPYLQIKHFKRSSVRSYAGENLYYYHITRSNLIYMYKHFNFINRNIIRLFFITGIIFRMLFLLFRIKFRGKKKQKLSQYKFMLRLYLSRKEQIYKSKYINESNALYDKKQSEVFDEFWKT